MMTSIFRLVAITLALVSSVYADVNTGEIQRKLAYGTTQAPTRAPANIPATTEPTASTSGFQFVTLPPKCQECTDSPTGPAPTMNPTARPTPAPTAAPTAATPAPTPGPTPGPTPSPTPSPTSAPTPGPTTAPTARSTNGPTPSPTPAPTPSPTSSPTPGPTSAPTARSTNGPTPSPTPSPTNGPTPSPTPSPTPNPTPSPTNGPTPSPTNGPTPSPTSVPTARSTDGPTSGPTESPTARPTAGPTNGPTPGPTVSPTAGATESPTLSPTPSPTPSPTISPTGDPTPDFVELGDDDDDGIIIFPPVGPGECPDDVLLVKQEGSTDYPNGAVQIISQDTTSVTIELTQTYTDSTSTIDSIYYQFKENVYSDICLEEKDLLGEESVVVTIECTRNSKIGLLEFWVADDITKGVLSEGDNAIIPECCHPTVPEGTPTTKYIIEVKCVSQCPEVAQ